MTTYISLPLSGASPYWGNAVGTAGALPLSGSAVGEVILVLDTESLYYWDGAAWQALPTGDVYGPASSTDNALARYDLATGKVLQNSGVTCDDSNNVEGVARLNASTAKVGGTGAAAASTVMELAGTTGALLLPRLTAAQIGGLTGTNGMLVYNADTDRFQGYFAGAWADLHGWGS